jgi:Protein of unknown function (DUF2948)
MLFSENRYALFRIMRWRDRECALDNRDARTGRSGPMSPQLKLIALDADDLAVISAHVQDARVKACDIIWRACEKRLVIGMSRLDWEQAILGEPRPRRLVAALRFDRVLACKSRNIDLAQPSVPLDLVGIEFCPHEAPGGCALLLFANGGALRLDLECLECELTDLGEEDFPAGEGRGG